MGDEVAKCIAEGMAEMALDTLEKKVKRQMGDVSKDEMPAGLGKLYFCRVEDLKDNPDVHPIPLGEHYMEKNREKVIKELDSE